MRSFAVLVFAGLCALACGYNVPVKQHKVAEKELLAKQAKLFELLQHLHQTVDIQPHLIEESKLFKFEEHIADYTKPEHVNDFVVMYEKGHLIHHDEIFSYHNFEHLEQAIKLFKVLFYAKDFDTFYKTLLWARFNVNPGMFVYAYTLSMLHRPDLGDFQLPAVYEIFPEYFFSSETIQKAHHMKMEGFHQYKKIEGVYNRYIVSNYSSEYYAMNEEQKLAYFTEDIGLNAFYYYFHLDYPFWMDGTEFELKDERRGELYLYIHQQLLARFYMERLSNDLGSIPEFSFYKPIKTGYYSTLHYYNGQYFPVRENNYQVYTEHNYYNVELVQDYERRIRDAIASGFITLPDGKHLDLSKPESIDVLGNLIQGNFDSPNRKFYGYFFVLAKTLLGGGEFDHHKIEHHYAPAVLEQFETTVRDPMFYQLFKRVIRWYWQFKDQLPAYKRTEIDFEGVKIVKVDIDKLETYMDKHDADITNAVNVEPFDFKSHKAASDFQKFGKISHYNGEELLIRARQERLNHMPFSYRLSVASEAAVPSVVRVFIGPKYDQFGHKLDLIDNRENFYLLDTFKYDLVAGENLIERDSHDYTWFVKDRTTFYELYKWVMTANKGETKFTLDMSESHNGIPNRLMLPKGKKAGMPFQFFFIVSPMHVPTKDLYEEHSGIDLMKIDSHPLGYPFDRKIDVDAWYTSNMFFKDVLVFHKKEVDINAPHYKV